MKKILEFFSFNIDDTNHIGGSQKWFKKFWHRLSGCGPVVAAETSYVLARDFPGKYRPLYAGDTKNIDITEFKKHMAEIRKFIIPGANGLTSSKQYCSEFIEFCSSREVKIKAHILTDTDFTPLDFIKIAINKGFPVSMLILKNPHKELSDFKWHWMTVIGYDGEDIIFTTYGKVHRYPISKLYYRDKKYKTKLVYFS